MQLKIFRYHFDKITIQHMLTPEVDNMVTQHIVKTGSHK